MTARKPKRAKQLGISDADYERLLAAQDGHCALCPNRPKTRRLHVDHDHATGKVRALLCYVCNRYLPASRDADWHRRAADYLDSFDRRKQLLALIPDEATPGQLAALRYSGTRGRA